MNETQTMHAMGIDDAYHVERVLASGPAGVTELVTIEGAGPFVRKRMPLPAAHREAWAMIGACRNGRIPRVEAMYELPDAFVVVQDYVPGPTLAQLVAEHCRLAPGYALALIGQVGEAVRELHRHGVIHRDITPKNVIVATDGAHLIDFGNARLLQRPPQPDDDASRQQARQPERDTTTLGTYGFAAPEQFGFAPTDMRSDIYSLGRLLGFMLTGVYPDDARYGRLLDDAAVTPAPLRDAIRSACAFEPSARPQDVNGFLQLLDGKPATAMSDRRDGIPRRQPDTPQPAPSPMQAIPQPDDADHRPASWRAAASPASARDRRLTARRRAVTVTAIAVVLVAAIVGGIMLWVNLRAGGGKADEAGQSSAQTTPNGSGSTNSGESGTTGDGSDDNAATTLTLKESGWSIDSSGYVNLVAVVHNASADRTVAFPSVTATGRDKSGKVLFSEQPLIGQAYPGQDAVLTAQAGDGTVKPATVDFAVKQPGAIDLTATRGAVSFAVDDVTARSDGTMTTFAGEVTPHERDGFQRPAGSMIEVIVVLRDKRGGIIYGWSGMVDWPGAGKPQAFSVSLLNPPAYASYDVHAQVN
ncbi:tyrosine kinase [Bifidobacterium leontopitheci]|uniref:Tyrosine kinase n=2 Tax=Bifidobacterium leontopitheci TaxID=2650774 RepID=A0A6I1GF76_9BIFI|nr:tyrosine kinase [Bifidobacterium leontopitheci]